MKRSLLTIIAMVILFSCKEPLTYKELVDRATEAELSEDIEAAKALYNKAIKIKPNKAVTYSLLAGVIARDCPDCDSVMTLLSKAYAIDSTDKVTIFNLAYINGRMLHNYKLSLDYYTQLIDLTSDKDSIAMVLSNRANMHLRLKDTLSYCEDLKNTLEQIEHEHLRNNYLINCSQYIESDMNIEVILDSLNKVDTIIIRK